ncbi:hypothetical protein CUMW_223130 [Citrus unshiu]|uniref:Uncharacterized protein n=1 Tax=Citrus unshiu TaxID=55188 RepID=A0A2H5QFZ1_CITUN|nr:hypothetical protein CUMW_223130 [Citrus unshiu]GAY63126.1 hypothetical protein CUMW_223130 [Citrus unshiu]
MADLRIVEEGLGRTQLVEQEQDDGKDSENGINKEKELERSEVQDEQKGELQLQQLLQQKIRLAGNNHARLNSSSKGRFVVY